MPDSIVSARKLARPRCPCSSFDLLEQNRLDVLQMRSHQLLGASDILALDRLENFPMVLEHRKTTLGYALDAPLEHEFFAGVVQHAGDRAVAGVLLHRQAGQPVIRPRQQQLADRGRHPCVAHDGFHAATLGPTPVTEQDATGAGTAA